MSSQGLLLVIGKHRDSRLLRALRGRGLAPVSALGIQAALRRVREGGVAAVLVPGRHAGVDVLEVVLNLRDLDPSTPVLVGNGAGVGTVREIVETSGRVVFLGNSRGAEELADEVERAMARCQDGSGEQGAMGRTQ